MSRTTALAIACSAVLGALVPAAQGQVVREVPPFFGGNTAIFDPEISVVESVHKLDVQATVSADRKYVTMTMRRPVGTTGHIHRSAFREQRSPRASSASRRFRTRSSRRRRIAIPTRARPRPTGTLKRLARRKAPPPATAPAAPRAAAQSVSNAKACSGWSSGPIRNANQSGPPRTPAIAASARIVVTRTTLRAPRSRAARNFLPRDRPGALHCWADRSPAASTPSPWPKTSSPHNPHANDPLAPDPLDASAEATPARATPRHGARGEGVSPEIPAGPAPGKGAHRRRRWPLVVGGILAVLLLLVLLAPWIASTGPVRSMVIGQVNKQLNGRVEAADWSLGSTTGSRSAA